MLLFSHSVISYSLQPRGLQHARLPCPSPTPGACLNSCPLNQLYHPTILSSVIPFSCLQSFPASWSFLISRLFASGAKILELQHQSFQLTFKIGFLFRIDWFDLLVVQGTLKSLLQHHSSKAYFFIYFAPCIFYFSLLGLLCIIF